MRGSGVFPGVSPMHLEVAKTYTSPLLIGPELCGELVALVQHMFTEEEADIVRHLKPWLPRTAPSLAEASGRPLDEVEKLLNGLAHEKHVLLSFGESTRRRYMLLPVVPGTFESVMVRKSPRSVTPWHKRFAELYEALYATAYVVRYNRRPVDAVRYLPVGEAVQAIPAALPSDRLEYVMDDYEDFAIGVCQCRLSKELVGEGCGRMLETCTVMGDFARVLVEEGRMRQASKRDVLEVKAAAEKEGLVTWMMNDQSARFFKCSCSCCGCCCGALRQISEFNVPGLIAPPHFIPEIDNQACETCGECEEICPTGALQLLKDNGEESLVYNEERCIGCGLCSVSCPNDAISMRDVPDYREPPAGLLSYLARYAGNYAINGLRVWSSRLKRR